MIVSTTIVALFLRKYIKKYWSRNSYLKKRKIGNTDLTEVEFLGI